VRIELPKDIQWGGWSAGGTKLIGLRENTLVEMPATASGEVRELRRLTGGRFRSLEVSLDGKQIFSQMEGDLVTFPLEGTSEEVKPRVVKGNPNAPFLSPDGHWLLFEAGESSVDVGVYAQPFPGPGSRRQIASTGISAVWRGDGKEILYYDAGSLMSVAVTGGVNPTFGTPRKLFSGLRLPPTHVVRDAPLAVSPDGSRIYWPQGVEQPESNLIHVKIRAVR